MRVFITRDIKETDFFKIALEEVGYTVLGESLIEFSAVSFDLIADLDWLFFYSKNGVRFFFNQLNCQQLDIIKNKKIGTIGKGTAKFLKQNYSLEPNLIGTGDPLQTAQMFAQVAENQKVLFPRAKKSKKSIQTLLSDVVEVIDLVVYKNQPKPEINIPEVDILVFTSPMNAQVYFQKYKLESMLKIIAIGNTTAKALRIIGVKNIIISKNPSEQSLVAAVCN